MPCLPWPSTGIGLYIDVCVDVRIGMCASMSPVAAPAVCTVRPCCFWPLRVPSRLCRGRYWISFVFVLSYPTWPLSLLFFLTSSSTSEKVSFGAAWHNSPPCLQSSFVCNTHAP